MKFVFNSQRCAALLTCLLMLLANAGAEAARSVRLSLQSHGAIAVGSKFSIDITVNDIDASPNISQNTRIPGAQVLYFANTGHFESTSGTVGGPMHRTVKSEYTLYLKATSPGTHTFGPITVGGVKSNSVKFTVGAKGAGAPSSQQQAQAQASSAQGGPSFIGTGNGNLFLRASVSKTSVFEQEAIVYTVKLYSTYSNIRFVGATAAPKFEGFVVEESKDVSQQLTFESYNGRQYAAAVIARYVIFPQMKGSLKILGNTYTVAVDEREYYNDPYFGRMSAGRPLQLNVKPNDLSINVKPLPQPVPANFSGGVGSFSISAALNGSSWLTNTPASVAYTVSGTGNLKYIKLPDMNAIYPKELEVFSPETKNNTSVSGGNVKGSVTFDYSVVPLEPGSFSIPEVPLVYFDPVAQKYVTVVSRGFNVQVAKGSASSKSQTNTRFRFNRELIQGGTPERKVSFLIASAGYWILFAAPAVLLGVAFILYRRNVRLNSDIIALRSRKAGKVAARRLKKARLYLSQHNADLFFDEILASLWGYVSDKLKIPTSELSRDNIASRLKDSGVPDDMTGRFIAILDDAEFAKFSPSDPHESMDRMYSATADILESMESAINNKEQ